MLLKVAILSPNDEHLIKVILIQTLDCSLVKDLLKRTFSDSRKAVVQNNEDCIKIGCLLDIRFQSNVS